MNLHSVTEGFKNLIRSFWLSATAIFVLIVIIASVVFVAGLRTAVGFSVRQLDKQLSIVVYVNENIDDENIDKIKTEIEKFDGVSRVDYLSKEENKQNLEQNSDLVEGFGDISEFLGYNPLTDSFYVIPESSEVYESVYNQLTAVEYSNVFDTVKGKQDVIESLKKIYDWINIVGVALIVIFALVSILVMINILRMSIYNYRQEIEIMRLVGATDSYIQGPFVMQGFYFNFFASLFVLSIFIPITNYYFVPKLESLLDLQKTTEITTLVVQMYISIAIVVIISLIAGAITSYFATKKYLKL